MTFQSSLPVKEIDQIIFDLDTALDAPSRKDKVKTIKDALATFQKSEEKNYSLCFNCPPELWDMFLEYFKQNELDPEQQIREAIVCYYRDLLRLYRSRARIDMLDKTNL